MIPITIRNPLLVANLMRVREIKKKVTAKSPPTKRSRATPSRETSTSGLGRRGDSRNAHEGFGLQHVQYRCSQTHGPGRNKDSSYIPGKGDPRIRQTFFFFTRLPGCQSTTRDCWSAMTATSSAKRRTSVPNVCAQTVTDRVSQQTTSIRRRNSSIWSNTSYITRAS